MSIPCLDSTFLLAPYRPNTDMDACRLNSRDVKHGQGFNEEDSLTDHKSPTNGGFPASIGLNTNGKVVRPSFPQTFHTY